MQSLFWLVSIKSKCINELLNKTASNEKNYFSYNDMLNSLTRSLIYDFGIETNMDILVDKQTIQL